MTEEPDFRTDGSRNLGPFSGSAGPTGADPEQVCILSPAASSSHPLASPSQIDPRARPIVRLAWRAELVFFPTYPGTVVGHSGGDESGAPPLTSSRTRFSPLVSLRLCPVIDSAACLDQLGRHPRGPPGCRDTRENQGDSIREIRIYR